VLKTIAGNQQSGYSEGIGTNARFKNPLGGVCDPNDGDIFVVDALNYVIRRISLTGIVSLFAGGLGTSGFLDGPGTYARLNYGALAYNRINSRIYFTDMGNHLIRQVTLLGMVTTVAGLGGDISFADGLGTFARMNYPSDIECDSYTGNVIFPEYSGFRIRYIDISTNVVSTIAGNGLFGNINGVGTYTQISGFSVAIYKDKIYVNDYRNKVLRALTDPRWSLAPTGLPTSLTNVRSFKL
jgi:hypothetical protein